MDLLLEQDRSETSVESTNTLILQHLAESTNESIGVCWLRDETNTGSLKRAERNISEEFCETSRGQVDRGSVVRGSLVSEEVDRLLLEEFISSELERALEEIPSSRGTKTGQESTRTFLRDRLSETSNETFVICLRVELYSGLDAAEVLAVANEPDVGNREGGRSLHIDGCEGTVGNCTADSTGQGESRVELDTAELFGGVCDDLLDDSIDLRRAGRGSRRCHFIMYV
jgi:hypothetical protein